MTDYSKALRLTPKLKPDEGVQRRFLAIDPGDEHVGLAEFECRADEIWYCVWAGEMPPEAFLLWFAEGV